MENNYNYLNREVNRYMTTKTKTLTLAMTSVVTLGAVTALLFGSNNNIFSLRGEGEYSPRTVTADRNNRMTLLCYKVPSVADREVIYLLSAFQLSQKDSYTLVRTSQNQRSVEENNNNCVLALWGGQETYFTVNPTFIDGVKTFYRYDTSTGAIKEKLEKVSKFDHLKSFDIVLDTSESNRASAGFTCDENYGTISDPVVGTGTTTFTWTANTESGFVDSSTQITVTANSVASGKVCWVKQLVFYYDC